MVAIRMPSLLLFSKLIAVSTCSRMFSSVERCL